MKTLRWLFVLTVFAVAQIAHANGVDDINSGIAAANRGDDDEAIRLYTRALTSGELSTENKGFVFNNRGNAWDDKKDYDPSLVAKQNAEAEVRVSATSASSALEKDTKRDLSRLIQVILKSGTERDFPNGFAQAVGLDTPMPTKKVHVALSGHGWIGDDRDFHVVYAVEPLASGQNSMRPICLYLKRGHGTKHFNDCHYYRVSLDGKLEKSVTLRVNLGEDGMPEKEGKARFEEDIETPEIQKSFKNEMAYWLNDWLMKQPKVATKIEVPIVPTVQ
jgi:hypothetical protein